MKSKFFKVLLIINGILIPIFIIYVLGNALDHYLKYNNFGSNPNDSVDMTELTEIRQSSLIKIPNSENYITAEYYLNYHRGFGTEGEDELNLPYQVPKNTFNIIFLDPKFNQIRKLLKKKGSIKSVFISNTFYSHNKDTVEKLPYLSFYIAEKDSNNDGKINNLDQHYVYISDLDGDNLTKISDRKVRAYEWVNDNKEILLTFVSDKDSKLSFGLYNVKTKTMTIPKTIKD